jgi:hypothetical protein
VIDKRPAVDATAFPASPGIAPDAATLLHWVVESVPPRLHDDYEPGGLVLISCVDQAGR